MLADAVSFWTSASSAIASINENISSALENFEVENTRNHNDDNIDEINTIDHLRYDLELYKGLLEDAQMQHFELSKQSRVLIAEKDVEILYYKKLTHHNDENDYINKNTDKLGDDSSDGDGSVDLKVERLLSQNRILESSLHDLEERYKLSLHDQNEWLVMKTKYEEAMTSLKGLKADLLSVKLEQERVDKKNNETIESLVNEYSNLASETELIQQQTHHRVNEVIRENEVLVTKLSALENNISDLADRSYTTQLNNNNSSSTYGSSSMIMNNSNNTSGTIESSVPSSPNRSPDNNNSLSPSSMEIKDLKSKLINIQFDMKAKDEEIQRLMALLSSYNSSFDDSSSGSNNNSGSNNESQLIIAKLELDVSHLSQDISRLIIEKKDAEIAGKRYHEQYKHTMQLYEALKKLYSVLQIEISSHETKVMIDDDNATTVERSSSSSQPAAASSQHHLKEIESWKKQIDQLRFEHQAMIERLHHDHSIQMEAIISKHDADVRAFKKEHVEQLQEVRAITDAKSVEYEQLQLKCCALEDQLGGMEGTSTTTTTSSVIEEMNHRIQSQLTEINHLENELLGMKERLQQVESEYESYRIDIMMEIQKRSQELNEEKMELMRNIVMNNDQHDRIVMKLKDSYADQLSTFEATHKQAIIDIKQSEQLHLESEMNNIKMNAAVELNKEIAIAEDRYNSMILQKDALLEQSLCELKKQLHNEYELKIEGINSSHSIELEASIAQLEQQHHEYITVINAEKNAEYEAILATSLNDQKQVLRIEFDAQLHDSQQIANDKLKALSDRYEAEKNRMVEDTMLMKEQLISQMLKERMDSESALIALHKGQIDDIISEHTQFIDDLMKKHKIVVDTMMIDHRLQVDEVNERHQQSIDSLIVQHKQYIDDVLVDKKECEEKLRNEYMITIDRITAQHNDHLQSSLESLRMELGQKEELRVKTVCEEIAKEHENAIQVMVASHGDRVLSMQQDYEEVKVELSREIDLLKLELNTIEQK